MNILIILIFATIGLYNTFRILAFSESGFAGVYHNEYYSYEINTEKYIDLDNDDYTNSPPSFWNTYKYKDGYPNSFQLFKLNKHDVFVLYKGKGTRLTWQEANAYCNKRNFNLMTADIVNDINTNLASDKIDLLDLKNKLKTGPVWLGLTLTSENGLIWQGLSPASYVASQENHPIPMNRTEFSIISGKCFSMNFTNNQIEMVECDELKSFACYWNYSAFKSSAKVKCSSPWLGFKGFETCFFFSSDLSTYEKAVRDCRGMGSELIYVDSIMNMKMDKSHEFHKAFYNKHFFTNINAEQCAELVDNPNSQQCFYRESFLLYQNCSVESNKICQKFPEYDEKLYLITNVTKHLIASNFFNRSLLKCPHPPKISEAPVLLSKDHFYAILGYSDPEKYYFNLYNSNKISKDLYLGLVQGNYQCEYWDLVNDDYAKKTFSKTDITFSDYKTEYVYTHLATFQPISWTDMYSFVSHEYFNDFELLFQFDDWVKTDLMYLDKVVNVSYSNKKIIRDLKFNLYTKLEHNVQYDDPDAVRKFLIDNSLPEEILIETKLKLKSSVGCYKEIIQKTFIKEVGLPDEFIFINCLPEGTTCLAKCVGNFTYGYNWIIIETGVQTLPITPTTPIPITSTITPSTTGKVPNEPEIDVNIIADIIDNDSERSNLTDSLIDLLNNKEEYGFNELLGSTNNVLDDQPVNNVQSSDISLVALILNKSRSHDVIIDSNTGKTMVKIVDKILNAPVSQFVKAQNKSSASLSIIDSLENLVNKINFKSDNDTSASNVTWPSDNLIIHLFEHNNDNHNNVGFGVTHSDSDNETNYLYNLDNLNDLINENNKETPENTNNDVDVSILLPGEIYDGISIDKPVRTSFIIYKTNALFEASSSSQSSLCPPLTTAKGTMQTTAQSSEILTQVQEMNNRYAKSTKNCNNLINDKEYSTHINSLVIMSTVGGRSVSNVKEKIKIRFRLKNTSLPNPTCVYAHKDGNEIQWLSDGVETLPNKGGTEEGGYVQCLSSHLTNFAVLAGYQKHLHSEKIDIALNWISQIGIILSIICLFLFLFFQIIIKKFYSGQYQIALINLAISLICVNFIIMFGLKKDLLANSSASLNHFYTMTASSSTLPTREDIRCMITAALLHYFLLVAFSWMLIEAILQYYKFVKVFNTHVSSFVLKTVLPAWILPAIIIIITASVDYKQFNGHKHHCWLDRHAFYFAFLLPLALIMVVNVLVFVKIIKSITCDRPKGMQTNQKKIKMIWLQVQAALCCFVIMGLTWMFAFFAYGKAATAMYFLFAIFNSLQGFLIFLLFNLREKPARKAWMNFFRKKTKHLQLAANSLSPNSYNLDSGWFKKYKIWNSTTDSSSVATTSTTATSNNQNNKVDGTPQNEPVIKSYKKLF